ncbi:Carboxylesterase 2 [compost metagenome]
MALSTYIPAPGALAAQASAANAATPVFAAHGTQDDVVPLQLGVAARDFIQARQHPLTWQTYPMGHSVCLEEIAAIGAWLAERFGPAGA